MKKRSPNPEPAVQAPPKKKNKMSLRFVLPLVLFYVAVGALLIWLETMVTIIVSYVLAAALIGFGGFLVFRYLRSSSEERISGMDLASGLALLSAGIVLAFNPTDLNGLFPKIWGLSLVFGGFLKIQYAFDEKTVNVNRWWLMLVFAAISLIVGILALFQESIFGSNSHLIIGIFMLAEAVLDLVTFFLISRGMKRQTAENEAARLAEQAARVAQAAQAQITAGTPAETPAGPETPQEE